MSTVCDDLKEHVRWRNHLLNRERLVRMPAVQEIKSRLTLIDPDFPTDTKKSYARAEAVWKATIKVKHDDEQAYLDEEDFLKVFSKNGFTSHEVSVAHQRLHILQYDNRTLAFLRIEKRSVERLMKQAAEMLPVYEWWVSHRGMDALGLANIVGECGDLSLYPNPDKLKKRMGLAPFKGRSCCVWKNMARGGRGLTADEWIEARYCPRRRSVMYQVGTAIRLQQGAAYKRGLTDWLESGYYQLYIAEKERKALQKADDKDWLNKKHGEPGARIDNHAKRYMEQRLLITLWAKWNGVLRDEQGHPGRETQAHIALR